MNGHSLIRNAATLLFASVAIVTSVHAEDLQSQSQEPMTRVPENPAIQFGGFVALTQELQELRESRRIPFQLFVQMAKEPNTVILDTRSKAAYDDVHISGAIHLNFSDFTVEKLRKTIPSQQTRILIYCNNNFIDDLDTTDANESPQAPQPTRSPQSPQAPQPPQPTKRQGIASGFANKLPALALNIPTFINLHGYGYKNVYELADRLPISDTRVSLAGKSMDTSEH